MSPWPAAALGNAIGDIETPALVLDLDAFERNLKRMSDALSGRGMRLRAHAKSHKCPDIALRQVAMGAVGICCQKVSEAAVFVEAGIQDVLVTNQIASLAKAHRLAALAYKSRIGVLVDHVQQVMWLQEAASAAGVTLDVYVEVNVGANRCGVEPGEPAVALAMWVDQHKPLRFAGLQCYQGAAQHMREPAQRKAAIDQASEWARLTRDAIVAKGLACERIIGAGTGTFWHERDSGVFNEIQAGSYVFLDRDYSDNLAGPEDCLFEHALFIQTTVMSRAQNDKAIVDAGLKASSVDSGMPRVWNRPDLKFIKASDEHGVLTMDDPAQLKLGDVLWLVPGHCDPTVNLYDELIGVRAGRVESIWPISARGALL
jgi:D-serine deaminase-like pyridoxal phosphate-dependent protein